MGKFDEFDLDIQVKQIDGIGDVNITSVSACTPGSCLPNCGTGATLNTSCCFGTYICSLGQACRL